MLVTKCSENPSI